jgi:hypothetical protein
MMRGRWFYYQPLPTQHPRRVRFRLWYAGFKNDLLDRLWPARVRRWEREQGITR